ncbi:MAG: nitroreductase family protein [Deltaproteobacteria bacterium]|nr:nitroreductase family protein [Deltaproteobacteria bacterium]
MIRIDKEKCTVCGICGTICPRHIPETTGEKDEKTTRVSQAREGLCMMCGQCMAVCPGDAISVDGMDYHDFKPVGPLDVTEESLLTLMTQRRSVRRYKDKPVPREILDRIIEACRAAPTGTASQSTGVLVIDKSESLEVLSKMLHQLYQDLNKALNNPIARFVIKRRVGDKLFYTLRNFVMPGMRWYLKWKKEGLGDEILRDCKALILFHSPALEPMGSTNCAISAFHGIFMAEILGVGTCFNDLIPPACNRSQEIRGFLGLPGDREIYSSVTVGYPRYKYRKVVPKRLAEVRYLS